MSKFTVNQIFNLSSLDKNGVFKTSLGRIIQQSRFLKKHYIRKHTILKETIL